MLDPQDSALDSPQNITLYSFGAGLGSSSASTNVTNLGEMFVQLINLPPSFTQLHSSPYFGSFSVYVYPQRPRDLSPAWLCPCQAVIPESNNESPGQNMHKGHQPLPVYTSG